MSHPGMNRDELHNVNDQPFSPCPLVCELSCELWAAPAIQKWSEWRLDAHKSFEAAFAGLLGMEWCVSACLCVCVCVLIHGSGEATRSTLLRVSATRSRPLDPPRPRGFPEQLAAKTAGSSRN